MATISLTVLAPASSVHAQAPALGTVGSFAVLGASTVTNTGSAILTGIGTVLADDPRLDVRMAADRHQPLRVILDSRLRTPTGARILEQPGAALLFSAQDEPVRRRALEERGAKIEQLADTSQNLEQVLKRLAELEINEILVEAGPTLAGAILQGGYADELLLYIAPVLLGPQGRALVQLPELTDLAQGRRFAIIDTHSIAPDLRLRLRPA